MSDLLTFNNDVDDSSTYTVEQKRIDKLAKLAELQQQRIDSKKLDNQNNDISDNNPESQFHHQYQQYRQSIESLLCSITDSTTLQQYTATIESELIQLKQLINHNAFSLSSHEMKQYNNTYTTVKQQYDDIQRSMQGKRKFGFKSRTNNTIPINNPQSTQITNLLPTQHSITTLTPQPTIGINVSNIGGGVIFCESSYISGNDVMISNVVNSIIVLLGSATQLRIHNITNSIILCGPVAGSLHSENCTNSIFYIASRQARIHTNTQCTYMLHTQSHPIIEQCSNMLFGEYKLQYNGIDIDYGTSELSLHSNQYKSIDDFNWLKQSKSPNWELIDNTDTIILSDTSQLTTSLTLQHDNKQLQALADSIRSQIELPLNTNNMNQLQP